MSSPDRIPVSGNGHQPPLEAEPARPGATNAEADDTPVSVIDRRGVAVNATPAQLAVGFGIVASLILLALGARRRRR